MSGKLLDTPAVARRLGLTEGTLRKWRLSGAGPTFIKLGQRSVRYREADLDAFIQARRAGSTGEADNLLTKEGASLYSCR